jgi:hypothetical protein
VVLSVTGIALAVIALVFADVIPDRAFTKTAMIETSVRIGMFVDLNKQLPPNLDALPKRNGDVNRTVDAWKRPLTYIVKSEDRSIRLTFMGDAAKRVVEAVCL